MASTPNNCLTIETSQIEAYIGLPAFFEIFHRVPEKIEKRGVKLATLGVKLSPLVFPGVS